MKKLWIVLLALAVSGCAHNDEWDREDTTMYLIASAAMVADGVNTAKIQDTPYCYEDGPAKAFLGRQPSSSDTAMYFGTLILSQYFIGRAMPKEYRKYWYGTFAVSHGYAAKSNCG